MASQNEFIAELRGRIARKEIRILAGAGVSMATTGQALSWTDTLINALDFLDSCRLVDPGWVRQEKRDLADASAEALLIKAEQITSRLQAASGHWAQWLKANFGALTPEHPDLINALLGLRLEIMTTNFDDLIAKTAKSSQVRIQSISWDEHERIVNLNSSSKRGRPIIHLHGRWSRPDSIVFSLRGYDERTRNELGLVAQRFLSSRGLLLVGCGATLDDPNISGLIGWLQRHASEAGGSYFRLVCEDELPTIKQNELPLKTICYGKSYGDLAPFLKSLGEGAKSPRRRRSDSCTPYLTHVVREWGRLDLPVPMEARKASTGLVEKLYVQRTFLIEGPDDTASNAPISFAAAASPPREEQPKPETASLAHHLEQSRGIVLVAEAGLGKTSFARYLAWSYATRRNAPEGLTWIDNLPDAGWIPVVVPGALLSDTESGQSRVTGLEDFIDAALRAPGFDCAWKAGLNRAAKDTKRGLLLIIDGLDEVAGPRRVAITGALRAVSEAMPHCRVVLTSRLEGLEGDLRSLGQTFTRLRLAPLDGDQIRAFLDAYLATLPKENVAALRARIESAMTDSRVGEVASTPLGLALLIRRSAYPGSFGETLSMLLRWLVNDLIERHGSRTGAPLKARFVVPILQYVALAAISMDRGEGLRQSELEKVIRSCAPATGIDQQFDPTIFLETISRETNLLVRRGQVDAGGWSEDIFGFLFKSVGEYLAGGAIVWARGSLVGETPKERLLAQVAKIGTVDVGIHLEDIRTEPLLPAQWIRVLTSAVAQMELDTADEVLVSLVEMEADFDTSRALAHFASRALVEMRDPTMSTVAQVSRACLLSVDPRDRYGRSALSAAMEAVSRHPATGEAAVNQLALEIPDLVPGAQLVQAASWIIAHLDAVATPLTGDIFLSDEETDAVLNQLESEDVVASVRAAVQILQAGFATNDGLLRIIPAVRASAIVRRMIDALAEGRPARLMTAWALAWLCRAFDLAAPVWKPNKTILAAIEKAARDAPSSVRGILGMIVSKAMIAPTDPYDQTYAWAEVADEDRDRSLRSIGTFTGLGSPAMVGLLEEAVDDISKPREERHTAALSLARFGRLTETAIATLRDQLLADVLQDRSARESIVHLGRGATPASLDALVAVAIGSQTTSFREWAVLALIANGGLDHWQRLLDKAPLDDLGTATLRKLVATHA